MIIADMDETICESCTVISQPMTKQIIALIDQGYYFAFISGSKASDVIKLISSKLERKHAILGNNGTHYIQLDKNRNEEEKYNHKLTADQKQEIMAAFEKLIEKFNIQSMTTKEDQLQDRGSQITLSAIGRNAPKGLKARYDPNGEKRKAGINFLRQYLRKEDYEIRIGGTTSTDVTRKGLDKKWGIHEFAQHHKIHLKQILFFGDKIYPGGNDYPASKIVDCISVKNPEETLRELKKLP